MRTEPIGKADSKLKKSPATACYFFVFRMGRQEACNFNYWNYNHLSKCLCAGVSGGARVYLDCE